MSYSHFRLPSVPQLPLSAAPDEIARVVSETITNSLLQLNVNGTLGHTTLLRITGYEGHKRGDEPLTHMIRGAQAGLLRGISLEGWAKGAPVLRPHGLAAQSSLSLLNSSRTSFKIPPDRWWGTDVMITGASSGLGRALACNLALKGARVFALARSKMALDELAKSQSGTIIPIVCDVANAESVAHAIRVWKQTHGGIKLFAAFHSAGSATMGMMGQNSEQSIMDLVNTNVLGTAYFVQGVLPHLAGGHLGIVSSGAVLAPWVGGTPYVTVKSAQHALAQALQNSKIGKDTHVMTILPGAFDSAIWDKTQVSKPTAILFKIMRGMMSSCDSSAAEIILDMERGRAFSTPGRLGTTARITPVARWMSTLTTGSAPYWLFLEKK